MLKYICTNCKYIYSPYVWDIEHGIESWVDFDDIDEFWKCPSCSEWKDYFHEITQSLQEIYSMENITPEEERHVPFYRQEDWKIYVTMWIEDNNHPSGDDHFIEYIWIFDEYWDEIEIINFPDLDNEVIFNVQDLDFFEVRASCNLHGVWKGYLSIS